MKIASVRIQNFRSFKDQTVNFDNYTCLVGPNGSGKSTVLTALNIFFRETENSATNLVSLSKEDFHQCTTTEAVRITVTFDELSAEAVTDLKDYVRQGTLVVSAVAEWNDKTQTAEVLQFGQRMVIPDCRKYFDLEKGGAKAPELQDFYANVLRPKFADLPPAKTKPQMQEAIHAFEAAHQELCELAPSADEFYGISRGVNRLGKYLQWVYVPAVKDASTEQTDSKTSAIGKLLSRKVYSQLQLNEPVDALKRETSARYKELLDAHTGALGELAASLNARFHRWAHDNASLSLQWQSQDNAIKVANPAAEVRAVEGLFRGEIARFGHGLQRSCFFYPIGRKADHTDNGPKLILGCEEPELYQHPPQARHLATVLRKLSAQNAEVILCTHSPYFVSGTTFENIRLASKGADGAVTITSSSFSEVSKAIAAVTGGHVAQPGGMAAKIERDMETPMREMFFADFRVFVEGVEDVAYISSYMTLTDRWDAFRACGGHIIPVEGKSHLLFASAIANAFGLPYYVVFDSDGDTPEDDPADPKKHTGKRKQHEADNIAILKLVGITKPMPFPDKTFSAENVSAWPTKLSDLVESEIGEDNIKKVREKVRTTYGIDVKGMEKNSLFIGYTMGEAWEQGFRSTTLEALCEAILKCAQGMAKGSQTKQTTPPTSTEEAGTALGVAVN